MKKLTALFIFALTLVAAAPGFAFFGQQSSLQGTVASVEESTINIVNQRENRVQSVEVQINDETEFEDGTSMNTLQEGDQIKVEYKEEGEEKIAISVSKMM